ncbi:MAG: helix-turn-helix transcriptional regulator [Patescibacteria group bacterium]
MKRTINSLTKWSDFEKKLLKNKQFAHLAKKTEHEYQLARSLIEIRLRKNITQEELAKRAHTKQPVISRLETGAVKPSISLLERVASALDSTLDIRFLP